MEQRIPQPFKDGRHIVKVTSVQAGAGFSNRRMSEYIEVCFEDGEHLIHQKFWNNEEGRKFYIDPLFTRFSIIPEKYDKQNLLKNFKLFLGKKVSIMVYSDEGIKSTGGYLPIEGENINQMSIIYQRILNSL